MVLENLLAFSKHGKPIGIIMTEITMSLAGFIASRHQQHRTNGTNGEKPHDWMFVKATESDKYIVDELMNSSGDHFSVLYQKSWHAQPASP